MSRFISCLYYITLFTIKIDIFQVRQQLFKPFLLHKSKFSEFIISFNHTWEWQIKNINRCSSLEPMHNWIALIVIFVWFTFNVSAMQLKFTLDDASVFALIETRKKNHEQKVFKLIHSHKQCMSLKAQKVSFLRVNSAHNPKLQSKIHYTLDTRENFDFIALSLSLTITYFYTTFQLFLDFYI